MFDSREPRPGQFYFPKPPEDAPNFDERGTRPAQYDISLTEKHSKSLHVMAIPAYLGFGYLAFQMVSGLWWWWTGSIWGH